MPNFCFVANLTSPGMLAAFRRSRHIGVPTPTEWVPFFTMPVSSNTKDARGIAKPLDHHDAQAFVAPVARMESPNGLS
ncbi:MAG: hypothetical protein ACT4O2_12625 [Beijerinckiaceae bacterium]